MSTTEYGNFNVFISWYNIVAVIVTLILYSGCFTQGLVKFSDERNIFASSLQGLTLSLVACWTFVYYIFHDFINKILSLTTVQVLVMLLMIWTSSVFNFWATTERVELRYKNLVILTIIVSLAKPILGIVMVTLSSDKVTARILGLAFIEVIAYSGLFFSQLRKGKTFISKKYWRYAFFFNIPLVPHYLSQMILNGADRIMIKKMCGSSEAGIYGLAYSIALIMTLFNSALLQTVEPWIYEKIKNKEIEVIGNVAYPSLLIICIVNLILIAFAPEAVAFFAPKSYHEAIWIIPPVAMSVYFMYSYGLFATFEFYYEKTKLIAIATLLVAILNILLNYFCINKYGYIAAGYTTLACYVTYALFHFTIMKRICNQQLNGRQAYSIKKITIITAILIVGGFIFTVTYFNDILRYITITILIGILLFKRKIILGTVNNFILLRKK